MRLPYRHTLAAIRHRMLHHHSSAGRIWRCDDMQRDRRGAGVFLTAWDNVSATERRDVGETRAAQVEAPAVSRAAPTARGGCRCGLQLAAFPKLRPRGYAWLAAWPRETWHGN